MSEMAPMVIPVTQEEAQVVRYSLPVLDCILAHQEEAQDA
jgi:hypothetical protein